MKSLIASICAGFAEHGLLVTPIQVRENMYKRFRLALPALREHRWPIPTTDEGIFVCLELLTRCPCDPS